MKNDSPGRSWAALGRSWVALGSLLVALGRSWAALGRSWAALGCSLFALGRSLFALGRSWHALGRSWVALGRSWAALGSSWAARGSPGEKALTPAKILPLSIFSVWTPEAYEDFVKETNASIEAKSTDIVNKSEEKLIGFFAISSFFGRSFREFV